MPNEAEAMALALIRLLFEATEGESLQWRMFRKLDSDAEEAMKFAVRRGWILSDDSRGITLTEAGRRIAEELGRSLQ